jgi:HAD superfamily hydrolase (TIGR01490 family)
VLERPFAAFDIDGTIIRWQLYHAIADELARQNLVDKQSFQAVKVARSDWKNRRQEDSFQRYEDRLVTLIDSTITQITPQQLQAACNIVLEKYKEQVYTFTRDLIKKLKSNGYLLFAISASQIEIVGAFANYYGFDDFGGSSYELKANHFTGAKNLLWSAEKKRFLENLVSKHSATNKNSFAFGDSESDIPMLGSVERPVAFNPTKRLLNHAEANHWQVIIERKNVIYELVYQQGNYVLSPNSLLKSLET